MIKIGLTLIVLTIINVLLSRSNSKELIVASKILMDEDALHVFNLLKNNSFKQKIDFHMINYQKSNKEDKQKLTKKI